MANTFRTPNGTGASSSQLAEFAKDATKGAHIQVEGELRSREYDSKKPDAKSAVGKFGFASILKLTRLKKARRRAREARCSR